MDALIQDLRFAVRMLFKIPGFTAVAIVSLALGIGANTTIFTWMKNILFQPLSGVANSEQIVVLSSRSRGGEQWSVSYPDYENWRDDNHVFSGVIAFDDLPLSLGTSGQSDRIWGMIVSGNYFDVLGVKMAYGRGFAPDEDRTLSTHPVTVLSHKVWKRRFGADPSIVGQTIQLNGRSFTVVGIAPENFSGTEAGLSFELWVPMMMQGQMSPGGDRTKQRGNHWMNAMARLKPGVSIAQAQAEMGTIAARLAQEYPNTNDGLQADVNPLWKDPTGGASVMRPILTILMVVVGLVLLLACANIANLLLARATSRQREISVRLALGAGRFRLIRQLLTESILLASLGGLAGIGVAHLCRNLMIAFVPPTNLPVALNFHLDGTVLGFAAMITLLTGIVFGLVPALQASKPDLLSALKDESGTLAGGGRKARLGSALVIAQVALSLLLLIGAGLFLRSVNQAQTISPGFNPNNMVVASIDLFPSGYTRQRGLEFYRQLLGRLRGLPGIEAVTLSRRIPLGFGGRSSTSVNIPGYVPRPNEEINIEYNNAGPEYFHTLGIPIVRGRDFTLADRDGSPDVAIINQTMARRYWPDEDPVGKAINLGGDPLTIVGIAQDGKYQNLNENPRPYFYLPLLQYYRSDAVIQARTAGDPLNSVSAIRGELQKLDGVVPMFDIKPMTTHLEIAVFTQRIGATFLGIFGLLALLLAAIGIYGVVSHSVNQRTHEIGIRMALGAEQRDVLALILKRSMLLTGIGLALGLIAAATAAPFASSLLLGITATDPMTFVTLTLLLSIVALIATYLPARKATRVDPLVALRYE